MRTKTTVLTARTAQTGPIGGIGLIQPSFNTKRNGRSILSIMKRRKKFATTVGSCSMISTGKLTRRQNRKKY